MFTVMVTSFKYHKNTYFPKIQAKQPIYTYIDCIPLTQKVNRITAGCRISHKNYNTVKQVRFQLSEGRQESGYHTHSNILHSYIYSPY